MKVDGIKKKEDYTQTTFNMMLQDLMTIDLHRKQSHYLLLVIRSQFEAVYAMFDALGGWYAVLRPIISKLNKDKFDKQFSDLEDQIKREQGRARGLAKKGVSSGASDRLRGMFKALLFDLYDLKHDQGLGMRKDVNWQKIVRAKEDSSAEDLEADAVG